MRESKDYKKLTCLLVQSGFNAAQVAGGGQPLPGLPHPCGVGYLHSGFFISQTAKPLFCV